MPTITLSRALQLILQLCMLLMSVIEATVSFKGNVALARHYFARVLKPRHSSLDNLVYALHKIFQGQAIEALVELQITAHSNMRITRLARVID